ncbi:MAG: hypothetical protein D6730_21945 [Bacteroidetes bacterium]|nr:MAG: hypothetical protein D6730_21945 [Bacteroidota bacterium]
MINVMYLVLLAILALNVSVEALDAFGMIRFQLRQSALETDANTNLFVAGMKKEILREIEREGKTVNAGLQDTLNQIRSRTARMIAAIDTHLTVMEQLAEYDPQTYIYKNKEEQEKNYRYWMGSDETANGRRGNGQARALRDRLDAYYQYLGQMYNAQLKADSLRKAPRRVQDPTTSTDEGKRWEQYSFEGPVVANMATLEALKIEVFREEKQLLELLNERLGVPSFVADQPELISAPAATIVPAGLPFETRLFVGMSSRNIHPEFFSNSGRIRPEANGNQAVLTIGADASVIPPGQQQGIQYYTAKVKVPRATGGYEELEIRQQFTVRRPEVRISSAAVQNLYRHCANEVNIEVPALGEYYDPVISASEAQIKQSSQSRSKFRIVPRGQQCVLSISSNTPSGRLKIDQLKYRVIEPPKPSIRVQVNGRDYNGRTAVPASSRLSIQVIPDAEFRQAIPQDAHYRIHRLEVLVQRGLQPARPVKTLDLSGRDATRPIDIRLGTAIGSVPAGTQVFLQIDGVYRRNFQGKEIEDRRFLAVEKSIGLTIR